MAASTALPPAFRISAPASVDSGCAATIIAFLRYRMRPPRTLSAHRVAEERAPVTVWGSAGQAAFRHPSRLP